MKNRFTPFLLAAAMACPAVAQQAVELQQTSLAKWNIGTAHYSGITPLGGERYAVVSDKEPSDGFFIFRISQNAATGQVTSVFLDDFKGNPAPKLDSKGRSLRDCEGIAFSPDANAVYISGEGDQQILEYTLEGQPTGRGFRIPAIFSLGNISPNQGFEALTYNAATRRFWTTTESMLSADGKAASATSPGAQNLLRLQAFNADLTPAEQYAYRMDTGKRDDFGLQYVLGVPALCALPSGKLLVLEREIDISNGYLSSQALCKIFVVDPSQGWPIDSSISLPVLDKNKYLVKTLLAAFTTRLTPFKQTFANYEGMCLGARLADGRQTLLLISDSQGGAGKGPIHLKDYIKVLILPDGL